ncbi:MAG: serine kinase [Sulfitobacter sp.]
MNGEIIHASTVAIDGQGVLIIGPSGAGKSALALQLIAFGAGLVADDRTHITRQDDVLLAEVPEAIRGLIEARGVGLIRLPPADPVPLVLVVDMGTVEEKRLPESHTCVLQGVTLPCLHKVEAPHFACAIWLSLKGGFET